MLTDRGAKSNRRAVAKGLPGGNPGKGQEPGRQAAVRPNVPVDPPRIDPVDQDPRERRLERGSRTPALSVWLVLGVIGLAVVAVYAGSAML